MSTSIPIWDIWIRLFHWSLAFTVGFSLISGETGFLFFEGHRIAGEIILLLLLFRIVWSVIGSTNTSLIRLFVNPMKAIQHVFDLIRGKIPQEQGHSASGGWAVLLMLFLLSFQAISGLFIADRDEMLEGVFYGNLSESTSAYLMKLHYLNADFIMVIVSIHILAIAVYALNAGRNLLTPMVTGRILWKSEVPKEGIKFQHWWVGAILLASSTITMAWLLSWW